MDTWRKLIQMQFDGDEFDAPTGDTWADVEYMTLTEAELDEEFDTDFGAPEGKPFTLWTHRRVYFPAAYDGSEWVASVPRHPCDEATEHVGGG